VIGTKHEDLRGQCRAGQRHVRACRRKRMTLSWSPRHIPGARPWPPRWPWRKREGRSGTDLLRAVVLGYDLLLPFSHGTRTGPRARHAPQRGGRRRDVFPGTGAAASLARLDEKWHALCALLCRATSIRPVELDFGQRATWKKRSTFRAWGARKRRDRRQTMVQAGF